MSIIIKNLSFSYPSKAIFQEYSKEFKDGTFYYLSSPSGKGKTTLFRLIAGLEKKYQGTIDVFGKVSYVFQENRLFRNFTVLENAELVSSKKHCAKDVLTRLGLEKEMNSYPDELSGGMLRRVALARALLAPFENLLLDEPFTGLDEETRDKAIELIVEMCKGKTVIIATHDDNDAEFCHEKIYLN